MSNYKHGHNPHNNPSPTYTSWAAMKRRCDNKAHSAYEYYGALGIRYEESWKSFENFLADMGERPAGTTLDRINNKLGYSKDNCRWATKREQSDNLPSAILNRHKVKLIQGLFAAKKPRVSTREWSRLVAPLFKVSTATIRAIIYNNIWK